MQNETGARDSTLGFRCAASMVHMVRAAAARQGILVSDWLRAVTRSALERELLAERIEHAPGSVAGSAK